MKQRTRTALFAATAAAFALAGASGAAPAAGVQLKVSEQPEYGAYLTDSKGRSLYLFEADRPATSNCYDACADAWPPLTTEGEPRAGDMVKAGLLGTIERRDGARQVTYDGMPLYYFVKDQEPGDTAGQDVEGFGGEWYLVAPDGAKVHEE